MQNANPEMTLTATVGQLTSSIELLLTQRHNQASLILLMATVDILGSVIRPKTAADTDSRLFKQWAEKYMITLSGLSFTSEELWATRCGLLHTHTPSSKLSRAGKVRQIHFFRGRSPTYEREMWKLSQTQPKLFVDIDELFIAFKDGVARFLADLESDASLREIVVHHSGAQYGGHRR